MRTNEEHASVDWPPTFLNGTRGKSILWGTGVKRLKGHCVGLSANWVRGATAPKRQHWPIQVRLAGSRTMGNQEMRTILAQLPSLTQQELATVRAACDHLLEKPHEVPALYTAMLDILGQVGPSYASFQCTASWKLWQKNIHEVDSLTRCLWPDMTKTQEASVNNLLLQLLVDDLKYLQVNVTMGSISSNLGRVPEVFERAFPGYRQGGFGGLVLQAMVRR